MTGMYAAVAMYESKLEAAAIEAAIADRDIRQHRAYVLLGGQYYPCHRRVCVRHDTYSGRIVAVLRCVACVCVRGCSVFPVPSTPTANSWAHTMRCKPMSAPSPGSPKSSRGASRPRTREPWHWPPKPRTCAAKSTTSGAKLCVAVGPGDNMAPPCTAVEAVAVASALVFTLAAVPWWSQILLREERLRIQADIAQEEDKHDAVRLAEVSPCVSIVHVLLYTAGCSLLHRCGVLPLLCTQIRARVKATSRKLYDAQHDYEDELEYFHHQEALQSAEVERLTGILDSQPDGEAGITDLLKRARAAAEERIAAIRKVRHGTRWCCQL